MENKELLELLNYCRNNIQYPKLTIPTPQERYGYSGCISDYTLAKSYINQIDEYNKNYGLLVNLTDELYKLENPPTEIKETQSPPIQQKSFWAGLLSKGK